jgi:dTDP-glucose pyrophosphorylase
VLFIFPHAIWSYLPRIQTSARGEIELQDGVQMMIDDGYKAYGLLQPPPKEWTSDLMDRPLRSS